MNHTGSSTVSVEAGWDRGSFSEIIIFNTTQLFDLIYKYHFFGLLLRANRQFPQEPSKNHFYRLWQQTDLLPVVEPFAQKLNETLGLRR